MNKGRLRALLISVAAVLVFAGPLNADIKDDAHIQSNADPVRLDIDSRTFNAIKAFFEEGYPPASVMLHAISIGMSIDDIVYLAVKSNPARAQEFYDTAQTLLPSLPGWVCRESSAASRYINGYEVKDLGANATVAEVARRFFDENKRLVPFPVWTEGKGHINASAQELAGLVNNEGYWYKQGQVAPTSKSSAPNRPIFISLYKENKQIIVDADLSRIRSGPSNFPVVFIYNDETFRPVSQFSPDAKVADIANEFFSKGIQLTAVPEWHVGDYHKFAEVKELKSLFDVPGKSSVLPARWQEIESELKENGFSIPLLVSVFGSGDGRLWLDQVQKVSVADALGIEQAPVVFFYHDLDRFACGKAATCSDRVCDAAIAGGADPAVCNQGQPKNAGFTPPGGAGGPQPTPPSSTPPPPPPQSSSPR